MTLVIPNVFQDGDIETASGVEVNENFDAVKAAIDAREITGNYSARVVQATNLATATSTEWTPSGSHASHVVIDIQLAPKHEIGGNSGIAKVYVGGVLVSEPYVNEVVGAPLKATVSVIAGAGQAVKVENVSGNAGKLETVVWSARQI